MTNDNALIKVRGLKKHYNYGAIRALDGVDLDIYPGDVMVIIGPSGSGKSTFLRSLNLLYNTSGMNKHMIPFIYIYKPRGRIDNVTREINFRRLLVISHLLNNSG